MRGPGPRVCRTYRADKFSSCPEPLHKLVQFDIVHLNSFGAKGLVLRELDLPSLPSRLPCNPRNEGRLGHLLRFLSSAGLRFLSSPEFLLLEPSHAQEQATAWTSRLGDASVTPYVALPRRSSSHPRAAAIQDHGALHSTSIIGLTSMNIPWSSLERGTPPRRFAHQTVFKRGPLMEGSCPSGRRNAY